MPRKQAQTLTDAELRLMDILWQSGAATVAEVSGHETVRNLAYSSILTTLRILERKGYVDHVKRGRAFVYAPKIKRDEACREALGRVMDRYFEGSPDLVIQRLIRERALSDEQMLALAEHIHAEIERRGLLPGSTRDTGTYGEGPSVAYEWKGKRKTGES